MDPDVLSTADILIVDDSPANVQVLTDVLADAGAHQLRSTTDPRQVPSLIHAREPDLILLDWHMPDLDGPALLAQVPLLLPPGTYLPILVLTADDSPDAKQQALALGAHDFVRKPFDLIEVILRCRNLLTTRRLHRRLQEQNATLAHLVAVRTQALETAHLDILTRLAHAVESRDDLTGRHTLRVGRLAARLAARLALPIAEVQLFEATAALHDLGKVAIPDSILRKPGPLDPAERTLMETHTTLGAQLLAESDSPPMRLAREMALSHHERWDGRGYPQNLAGAAIPLGGRVVAVADVWDTLTHARPYKAAWPWAAARQEIATQSGRQFDPDVVAVFLELIPDRPGPRPLHRIAESPIS
jgi:putative two-component system response regulator